MASSPGVPAADRQYLIDGDNIIGSWGGPRPGDSRRDELVRAVTGFCASKSVTAVLVFDHPRGPWTQGPSGSDRVSVRIARAEETADDVIRGLLDGADVPAARMIVVTSDKPLYSYAVTRGASVLRAHEWNRLWREAPPPRS